MLITTSICDVVISKSCGLIPRLYSVYNQYWDNNSYNISFYWYNFFFPKIPSKKYYKITSSKLWFLVKYKIHLLFKYGIITLSVYVSDSVKSYWTEYIKRWPSKYFFNRSLFCSHIFLKRRVIKLTFQIYLHEILANK